jgi:hypothetical protein
MDRNASHILLNPIVRKTLRGFLLLFLAREAGLLLAGLFLMVRWAGGGLFWVPAGVFFCIDGVRIRLGIRVPSGEGPRAPV